MEGPILILGAHGGIGEALVRRLHRSGRPLFLSSRNADGLVALSEELNVPARPTDVLDEEALAALIDEAAGEEGLGGLAFCVGSIPLGSLRRASAEDYLAAFRLNTLAPALALKHAAVPLRKARGSVVLFSSIAVQQGFVNHAVIAAAKGGVEALVRTAAAELAPEVRVNAVAPSLTRTELAAPFTRNEQRAASIAELHPLPRLGEAEDMAAAAAFLLSPEASWITGQVLPVDGGRGRLRVKG